MNTRVWLSFLIVALLLLVFRTARREEPSALPAPALAVQREDLPALPEPLLALQRCFPRATIRPLPAMRYYDDEIIPLRLSSSGASAISADGKRLFFTESWKSGEEWKHQSLFLDLTTGEVSIAKMRDQQPVEYDGRPLSYMSSGVWDPVEPAYLYATILDYISDDAKNALCSIWRMNVETRVATQILPPGRYNLSNITPDGRYLLCCRYVEGGPYFSRYSLEMHTWTPPPTGMDGLHTYAPNGELVAGVKSTLSAQDVQASKDATARGVSVAIFPDTALTIRNLTTNRLAEVFDEKQAMSSVPPGARPELIGAPTWLPDSAGLLVNMRHSIGNNVINNIWQVGINGEAAVIAAGVSVIANSQNGRHWLLLRGSWDGQQFYVMTMDDTAPEE